MDRRDGILGKFCYIEKIGLEGQIYKMRCFGNGKHVGGC